MKTKNNDKEAKAAKRKANRIARKAIVANGAPEIKAGMIVKYNDPTGKNSDWMRVNSGWMRVRSVFSNTVNLGSIFGKCIYHKGVPKSLVIEDEAAWYESWQKTDAYQCM